ncbi:stearoyl-CoA 9-desaturase [Capsaspora owczarzaki ATCC 30864]|uniref:Stearoyl-CoA 9-desaturase n=1 Tax=Capsaspora owczarzaki (strain ATCC 30864) TaxID=595528 RepID=A0A0D2WII6_CAPO3|nr:stearoyl-CoA 9-desaturase [Capsaspora owczarzaki ATCC 30864]KJE88863.1 stearoyl-CoA 9-desaturase [Capsaspora owczarzaki ATCC 30864]|eukprot:XP_004365310.1 stearoyl-CoA 9-desaturase [Capsaspora owczarzaki ATCC 30864]
MWLPENDPVRQLGAPGPLRVCIEIAITLLFGWPAYLTTHVTGHKYERRNNHFEPWSPMFSKDEYWLVVLSDAALLVVLAGLGSLAYTYSFAWLFAQYVVPLLIVNFWLVLITYLQHTDETLPHFRGTEWSWLRGALCTVDRDFGLLNHVFHHIGDTHVTHHVFSYMPHYHAEEATAALKPLLGEYYRRDDTPIAVALWRSFNVCRFVDATGEVLWFRQ